jgi:anti-sigma28 factor (negative regulator of flagellin synthesis)
MDIRHVGQPEDSRILDNAAFGQAQAADKAQALAPIANTTNSTRTEGSNGAVTDSAAVSDEAKKLLEDEKSLRPYVLQALAQPDATSNPQRLAAIKAMVANGTYLKQLDPKTLADSLLSQPSVARFLTTPAG